MNNSPLVLTPLHPAMAADAEWWRTAVIYQIYPRSFADASGDGIGDLPGVVAHLDHLVNLGVDAVWLSPFYTSPQADAGYDVADYRDVDPLFGTLADAEELVARAHDVGIRVIVDLVPNHTSSAHPWFAAALAAAPGSAERGRYIFRDGRGEDGEIPPNGWRSVFGGPAWTRVVGEDGSPEQWYLHLFDEGQPDLDWTNPEVHDEFEHILRFWLDRGVDGFRVDVAHGLAKVAGLPDDDPEPPILELDEASTGAGNRGPMWDQEHVHEIYRHWRQVLDGYPGERILVAEAWVEPLARLARYVRDDEMHQAFNFSYLTAPWDAATLRRIVTASLRANDAVGAPSTWVLSNHDVVRHPSRLGLTAPGTRRSGIGATDEQPDEALGLRRGLAATLLTLALPGSAYLFQGEELGLPEHTALDDTLRQDPMWHRSSGTERGRDGCRVPLPWVAEAPGFGFSPTGAAWLPQPEHWAGYAADVQDGVPGSPLETYRSAIRARRSLGLGAGSAAWVDEIGSTPVDGTRTIALLNGGTLVVSVLQGEPVLLPRGWEVVVSSAPVADGPDGQLAVPADTTVWARPSTSGD